MGQHGRQAGFSYIEILLSIVVVSICLVPAMQAFSLGLKGGEVYEGTVNNQYRVRARLTEVLAQPYANLDAEAVLNGPGTSSAAYSDTGGTPDRLLVYLSRYDADNADLDGNPDTGGDEGLVLVRVEIAAKGMTLRGLARQ